MRKTFLFAAAAGVLFAAAVLLHLALQTLTESQGSVGATARSTCSGCHGA